MIRVVIADDSAVIREMLAALLSEDAGIQVVGLAQDGHEATQQTAQLRPDVVVMDVYMPRMHGFEATRQIMEQTPTPIVMVSASFNQNEVAMTFNALEAGALTMLNKPAGFDRPAHAAQAQQFVNTVKLMAEVKVVRRWPKRLRPTPPAPALPSPNRTLRLVAIGASTGGPQVLEQILAGLPGTLGVPILVVQHITPGFTPGLAAWLDRKVALTVKLPEAGETASAGMVYIAPDGSHMGITSHGRIHLHQDPGRHDFCPSVSYVFESVAQAYNRSAMGIILTGMGQDGAQGLLRLREASGVTIAQDEESSIVFGMPKAAIGLGAVEHILSPLQITQMIRSMAGG